MWEFFVALILCVPLVRTKCSVIHLLLSLTIFGRKLMIRNVWFHVLSQVSALCPKDCWCPPDSPRCAADVALMLDGCGCCKVCGRQLFEDCSKTQPCDYTKGLECNFGGGSESVKGICRGTVTSLPFPTFSLSCCSCFSLCLCLISSFSTLCSSKSAKSDGRPCEYNNRIYQNGELFRPSCKHQCTCMDGVVGCVSLCPFEPMLPRLGCAKQRQVKTPGRCCERLACPESSVVKKHRKKHSKETRESENDLANRKKLTAVWKGEAKSLPGGQN